MGRTYFVEEAVGRYLSDLSVKFKPYVTGLLIGQVSVWGRIAKPVLYSCVSWRKPH